MDSGFLSLVNSQVNAGNIVTAILLVTVYLVIYFQRKNTAATRDAEIAKINKELEEYKVKYELLNKEIEYMKETMATFTDTIGDIKESIRNIEITMTKIATVVNTLAEKRVKIDLPD